MMDKVIVLFVGLLALTRAQINQIGQCSGINLMNGFNVESFFGNWYEIGKISNQYNSCSSLRFTPDATYGITLTNQSMIFNFPWTDTGFAIHTSGTAQFNLYMASGWTNFWILDTDYNNYVIAISCNNISVLQRTVNVWQLGRTLDSFATQEVLEKANAALQPLGLSVSDLQSVDHSADACTELPEIAVGTPVILPGQCRSIDPVQNFQLTKFTGTWHEISSYYWEIAAGSCARVEYTQTGSTVEVVHSRVINESLDTVSGTAALVGPDGSGILSVVLDVEGVSHSITIHVLDTDYDGFAILYSCENLEGTNNRRIHAWKLSRNPSGFSVAINQRISQVMANNIDLNDNYFQLTGQTNNHCFYYPDFEENPEAIILPGTCQYFWNIDGITTANYMGNWYEVAALPTGPQNRGCSRSEYSSSFGLTTIRNTFVVDRQLKTQTASATFLAVLGIMTVSYRRENGDEATLSCHILETDHISYSLVYCCRNQEGGTIQVFSWKLSRTPTLTDEANIAINNAIGRTQGLLEEYYVPSGQTAEDCFYVPEYVPGQSVLFRGACEAVAGMQGFDANQYLGWWNEIERYPGDGVAGQCTSALYVQSGTVFHVMESSVAGGVSNETTSNVVLSSDGTITIQRSTGPIVWHVLDTDYDSYSLLYACEDVTTNWGNYRRVWSAKHSKARSLTQAAQNAMDPLIAAHDLLHETLYETVDHSAAACLHSREEVLLPGQCDEEIPIQSGFYISRFEGTWYQLERYPYAQVSNEATCIGAQYIVNRDGISVVNWELLDNTLIVIRSSGTYNQATATLRIPLGQDISDLRILTTDYLNFALAYTCVNVDANQRSVRAFKLSRSRTLSSASHDAIEAYMANREELQHHYFISVEQNDECPNSALWVQSSVIVMLVSFALQLVM